MVFSVLAGLLLQTPQYEAQVKMLIQARKYVESPYYRDISEYRNSEMTLTQSEIVRSVPVLERVVKSLKLYELPNDYEKQFSSPVKSLFIDLSLRFSSEKPNETTEDYRIRKTLQKLRERVKVEPIKDTDLFTISVLDFDPNMSAKIANVLSRSYCIFDLEQKLAELEQKYGPKHLIVIQLTDNINKLEEILTQDTLPTKEAIGPASVKIIEQAISPLKPIGLSKKIIILVSLLMSIMFGIVMAFISEMFDTSIKSPEEVTQALKLPLIGYIPKRETISERCVVIIDRIINLFINCAIILAAARIMLTIQGCDLKNPVNQFVYKFTEPFVLLVRKLSSFMPFSQKYAPSFIFLALLILARILFSRWHWFISRKISILVAVVKNSKSDRTHIKAYQDLVMQVLLKLKNPDDKVLLMVSTLSREGTTSIVANIGRQLALKPNSKILLIDANMRNPRLHSMFKLSNNRGLAEILRSEDHAKELTYTVERALDVITAGHTASDFDWQSYQAKFQQLLIEARKKYSNIILDCSHLKDFNDASIIAENCDDIILVISEARVRKEVIKASLVSLERKKAYLAGAIFNNRTFAIPDFLYPRA
jgi:capsular exopolysaccharide synthesis family protein